MSANRQSVPDRRAAFLLAIGGVSMALLWLVFTRVHGPTSYNLDRPFLGGDMLFWGRILGGVPTLFLAAGVAHLYPYLVDHRGRQGRIGCVLLIIALLGSALIDLLVWQALGPPFFLPLVGVGALFLAIDRGDGRRIASRMRSLFIVLAMLQFVGFLLMLVPQRFSDSIGGYRIAGTVAYFAAGLTWLALGFSVRQERTQRASPLPHAG